MIEYVNVPLQRGRLVDQWNRVRPGSEQAQSDSWPDDLDQSGTNLARDLPGLVPGLPCVECRLDRAHHECFQLVGFAPRTPRSSIVPPAAPPQAARVRCFEDGGDRRIPASLARRDREGTPRRQGRRVQGLEEYTDFSVTPESQTPDDVVGRPHVVDDGLRGAVAEHLSRAIGEVGLETTARDHALGPPLLVDQHPRARAPVGGSGDAHDGGQHGGPADPRAGVEDHATSSAPGNAGTHRRC